MKEAAGVAVRFHDGRHTFVTDLAESGAPDEVIRSTVGHVSTQMLRHYSHIRTEAKRDALAAVQALNMSRRSEAEDLRKMEARTAQGTESGTSTVVQ